MPSPLFGHINIHQSFERATESETHKRGQNEGQLRRAPFRGSDWSTKIENYLLLWNSDDCFLRKQLFSVFCGGWKGGKAQTCTFFQYLGLVSEDNQTLSIVIFSLIFFSLNLQIFDGNCDHFTPVVNILEHGMTARYVRFHPVTYNYVCMRVEVYGCDSWLPWL